MYSISKLCNAFHLSRSTLLYYDSIGLLKASGRTVSNYRMYSDEDMARLEQICTYREAGVALEQIKELLESKGKAEEDILRKRLLEVNNELYLLRLQQKIIIEILKSKNLIDKSLVSPDHAFISVLKSSGINEEVLNCLHAEYERKSPEEHQNFLEFLGLDSDTIHTIREKAKADIELA